MRSTTNGPIRRFRWAAMAVVVALPLAVACAPVKKGSPGAPPDLYTRVNQLRAVNGAGPLAACSPLVAAAQGHADDMAFNGFFSHTGSDGSSPFVRIQRRGYAAASWGEILAQGQPTAEAVVAAWASSPSHSQIMLDPGYQHVGFGYTNGKWVGDFGAGGPC